MTLVEQLNRARQLAGMQPLSEEQSTTLLYEAKLMVDGKQVKKGDALTGGQPGMKFKSVGKNDKGKWVVYANISPAPRSGYSQVEISPASVGGTIEE